MVIHQGTPSKNNEMSKEMSVPDQLILKRAHAPRLRRRPIINHHPRALLQRRDQISQDLDAVQIRPIVKDVAEEIDIGALDGLGLEEIMRRELDARLEFHGDGAEHVGRAHAGQVLDDEVELGEFLGDGEGDVALGAAELVGSKWESRGREGEMWIW